MQKSSKIGLGAALALLIVGVMLFVFSREPSATPDTLIRQTLKDAESGAKAHDANQIMGAVSEDFHAGLWNKKRLYLQVLRSMRDGRGTDYDARVNEPRILPSPKGNPNERLVFSQLSVFDSGSGGDLWGSGNLTLVMRKESRPRLLFFREPYWRVVSVANLPPMADGL